MNVTRRLFLAGGAAAGAGLLTSKQNAVAETETNSNTNAEGKLRFSCQEWILPPEDFQAKIDFARYYGIEGIELGGGGLSNRVNAIQKALDGSGVQVSAICAGFSGVPISDEKSVRDQAMESCKEILQAAGALGSTGLIIVPAFNGQTKLDHVEGRKVLIDFLYAIADTAQLAGTRVLMEPLNRNEAWFLRQLHDAAAICRDVNHPAIRMMGDFYHMGIEEVCDYAAFYGAREYCHHVHLASRPNRKQPGYDANDDFRPGFRALKEIGFQDFCSFECGIEAENKEQAFKDTLAYLKKHWEEA